MEEEVKYISPEIRLNKWVKGVKFIQLYVTCRHSNSVLSIAGSSHLYRDNASNSCSSLLTEVQKNDEVPDAFGYQIKRS